MPLLFWINQMLWILKIISRKKLEWWHEGSVGPLPTETTITIEYYLKFCFNFWKFLKNIEQIKKHLFKAIHEISVRRARVCDIWGTCCSISPAPSSVGQKHLSWWVGQRTQALSLLRSQWRATVSPREEAGCQHFSSHASIPNPCFRSSDPGQEWLNIRLFSHI